MRFLKFRVLVFFVVTAMFGYLMKGEARAEFTLTPGVSLQVEYNDNIYLTDQDKVDDLSTIIVPNIMLKMKRKYLHTDLNYSLVFKKYLNETSLDDDNFKDIHRGNISGEFLPESNFSIPFEGSIARVQIDNRGADVTENDNVNVTTQYNGLVRPRYKYRLTPKVTGELAYQLSTSQYSNTSNNDSLDAVANNTVDQDAILQMDFAYSEQLKLQLETYYNWHDSDGFDDSEMWHSLAGFVWVPITYWSLEAKAGKAITYVDNGGDTLNDTLARVILKYSQPEKLSFFTSYIKDVNTSIDQGRYKWWEVSGGASYESRISGDLRVYTLKNTYEFVDREDEIYGVNTLVGYDLTPELYTKLFADYSHRTYKPDNEKVHRYRAGLSLTRKFEHASISIRYAFNFNDSDQSGNDYKSNSVLLSYDVKF